MLHRHYGACSAMLRVLAGFKFHIAALRFYSVIKKKKKKNAGICLHPNPERSQWCNEESSENGNYRNDNKGLGAIARGCIVGHYHKGVMCLCCGLLVREQAKEIITISG